MNRQIAELASDEAKELFMACVEVESKDDREAILRRVGPELASRVRDLIAAVEQGEVIDHVFNIGVAQQLDATQDSQPGESQPTHEQSSPVLSETPGVQIGNYKLLEEIGEGGMGTVFMAQQTQPVKRRVAIKIVKPGMDSRQVLARFEAERQALALMDHPNIARIFDGGTTEAGRPYFVMELVKGIPLTDFCQRKKLSVRERLELFVELCRGVQHAHQRGVIHRDLKPSNVLVTLHDGKPVVKIIDFGIAKAMNAELTDKTLFTQFAAMVGTPLYMSPEQAELSGLDVDTRCDVYSLGVLLYEVLTDTTPFDRETLQLKGLDEVRRMIRETEPPRPSQRISTAKAAHGETIDVEKLRELKKTQSILTGELDWIAMKALEKDRERRYQSAADFADDVQRHLDGEAVIACPPTVRYRVSRYARRHRVLVAASALVMLSAALGTAASLVFANQARIAANDAIAAKELADKEATKANRFAKQRDEAANRMASEAERAKQAETGEREQRVATQQALYLADMRVAESDLRQNSDASSLSMLLKHFPSDNELDARGWEWYYMFGRTRMSERAWYAQSVGHAAEWSSDGTRIVTTGRDAETIHSAGEKEGYVWDAQTGELIETLPYWGQKVVRHGNHFARTWSRGSAPDGVRFGTGGVEILNLDTQDHQWVISPESFEWLNGPVAFNNKGNQIAVRMLGVVKVYERFNAQWTEKTVLQGTKRIAGWSAEDRFLVCIDADFNDSVATVLVFDGDSMERISEFPMDFAVWGHPAGQCHPSKPWVALPTSGRSIVVLDLESGERVVELDSGQLVADLKWSHDGEFLTACGDKGLLQIWTIEDWSLADEISAHATLARTVSWSPDSRRFVSMGSDGYCAIWSLDQRDERPHSVPQLDDVTNFLWTDNATIQCSLSGRQIVEYRLTDQHQQTIFRSESEASWELVAPNLVLRDQDVDAGVALELRDLSTGLTKSLGDLAIAEGETNWSISPRREVLATATRHKGASGGQTVSFELVNFESGQSSRINLNRVMFCRDCAWAPNGRRIAFVGTGSIYRHDPAVFVVDTTQNNHVHEERVGDFSTGQELQSVGWSPDGLKLVVGHANGRCDILDSETLSTLAFSRPLGGRVTAVSWHPKGDRIASGNIDGQIAIWDSNTGTALLTFEAGDSIDRLRWSPDGWRLAALTAAEEVKIWDASEGYSRSVSESFEDFRRERYKQYSREAGVVAHGLIGQGEWKAARDHLRPWVVKDSSNQNAGEVHPWAPATTTYQYFCYEAAVAKQEERIDAAVDYYKRAAPLAPYDLSALIGLTALADRGTTIDGFKELVDATYTAWLEYRSEWLQSIESAADPERGVVKAKSRLFAKEVFNFSLVYRRTGVDQKKVIELCEKTVQMDPDNAEYFHHLASAYFAGGEREKAIESAEKALELNPDFKKARKALERYRSAERK